MINAALILASAILGKIQGGWKIFGDNLASTILRKIDGFLLGLLVAYVISPSHWVYYPLLAVSVKLAEQPSVGVKGWFTGGGYFTDDDWHAIDGHPYWSAIIRGAIGGIIATLPVLAGFVVGFDYNILLLLPLYTVTFPLVLIIGREMPTIRVKEWLKLDGAWNWSEPLQPAMIMTALVILC